MCVGGNCGPVWCDISSVCIGPGILHGQGWLMLLIPFFSFDAVYDVILY